MSLKSQIPSQINVRYRTDILIISQLQNCIAVVNIRMEDYHLDILKKRRPRFRYIAILNSHVFADKRGRQLFI